MILTLSATTPQNGQTYRNTHSLKLCLLKRFLDLSSFLIEGQSKIYTVSSTFFKKDIPVNQLHYCNMKPMNVRMP